MAASNNKDVAKLNEYNLGCLEGMSYAKEGKMLEDILPKVGTKERQNGVKAGYAKYLSEAAADDNGSMNPENDMGGDDFGAPDMGTPDDFGPEGDLPPVEGTQDDLGVEQSVDDFNNSPTFDSFHKVFKALGKRKVTDSAWLKAAAFFYVHSPKKIKDDLYIQVESQVTMEYWLNRLLADEFTAWYQYYIVEKFLLGDERPHIQETFKTNADDELNDHADKLLKRIHDLGYSTSWLTTPKAWDEYATAAFVNPGISIDGALAMMVKAEETAIAAYSQAIVFAEQVGDVVSRDLFKNNLADEQEHMANLMHFQKDKLA